MQFTSTLSALVGVVVASIYLVGAQEEPVGLVSFCPKANFTGACLAVTNLDGSCDTIRPRLVDEVSSIQLQPGSTCYLFKNAGCSDPASLYVTGSIAFLSDYGFNDVVNAYKCSA